MTTITTIFGTVLSLIGLTAYIQADHRHITALIPSFFGIPLFFLGLAGRKKHLTGDAMHAAAGVGLLSLLVSGQGLLLPDLFPQTAGGSTGHPRRPIVQGLTLVVSAAYMWLSFKWFLDACRWSERYD